MSSVITFNGQNYIIPATGDTGWGNNVSSYLIAIAAGSLQKTGGAFTLSDEIDFGASFGVKSLYYKSRSSNVSVTGILRGANGEPLVSWRNAGNSADLPLSVNGSNQLTFNGNPIGGSGIYTASRAVITDGSGNLTTATTTSTEIGYLNGVTSAIQTQLNLKAPLASPTFTGVVTTPTIEITNGTINPTSLTNITMMGTVLPFDPNFNMVKIGPRLVIGSVSLATSVPSTEAIYYNNIKFDGLTYTFIQTGSGLAYVQSSGGAHRMYSNTGIGGASFTPTLIAEFAQTGNLLNGVTTFNSAPIFSSLTATTVPYLNGSKALTSSAVTPTELGYLSGVTSAIQTQLDAKAPLASPTFTGTVTAPALVVTNTTNQLVLGTTRTVTITAPTPATTSRTWTLPDLSTSPTFAALEAAQTFSGAKTFSSALTISASSGNTLVVNTNDLVVDSTNHRVGIGTASPASILDIAAGAAELRTTLTSTANSGAILWDLNTKQSGGTAQRWLIGTNISVLDSIEFRNQTAGANVLTLDRLGNIVPGSGALATNATNGFTYIETCAGTPTGVPTTFTGRVATIYDTSNNKLYVYNGAWKSVTLA